MVTGKFKPDYATIPGDYLAEILETRGISQAELARQCKVSSKLVSEILSGKNGISANTALALEEALGVSAQIWIGMEGNYQLYIARQKREDNKHAAE